MLGTFDDARFARIAVEEAPRYRAAAPFPHACFDGFLDTNTARTLARAFPRPDRDWVVRDTGQVRKTYQHDETRLPDVLRSFLRELNSRQFLLFLETLTGIDNLLPDPYLLGGGVHLGTRGDFLKIHADFNWHHKLQAHRRVNALLYLNEDWKQEWGGELELWDKEMTSAQASYAPLFNRLVVFNTDEDSNHGHPHPMTCPEGEYRKALNLYYYTTRRDDSEIHEPHFTKYKTQASELATELGDRYRKSGTLTSPPPRTPAERCPE